MDSQLKKTHVCPWWLGYFLITPIRKLYQDPDKILSRYIREGMMVLEVGPGMGYFSLPMAHLVGPHGKVLCVDLQEKMLGKLMKRASRAGLAERISPVLASQDSLRLDAYPGTADFALAFAVVHEIPDQSQLFEEIYRAMKPGSLLLVSEPKGHVTSEVFQKTIDAALLKGFQAETPVHIAQSISMIFRK